MDVTSDSRESVIIERGDLHDLICASAMGLA
jgi:hypothetical protein